MTRMTHKTQERTLNLHSLVYYTIKAKTPEQPNGVARGHTELPCTPQAHDPLSILMCPPTQKLPKPCHLGDFTEISLLRTY